MSPNPLREAEGSSTISECAWPYYIWIFS